MIVSPLESEERVSPNEDIGLRFALDANMAEIRAQLFAYLCRRVDRETAADFTQEALLRMMKSRDAHIEDRRAMLARIAHNLIVDHRRAQSRHHASQHVSLEDVAPLQTHQPTLEAMVDTRQALDRLLTRTVAELPPKCRHAFMLNRFDGLTRPQVATKMGISLKAVEKHITRALAACRLAVGDCDV